MKLPFLLTIDDLPIGQISRGWGGSTWGHRLKIATWQPTAVKQPQSDAQTFQTLFSYFLKKSVLSILAIHKYNDGKFPFFLFVMGSVSATSNFGDFHWSLFNKCIYSQCSSFRGKVLLVFGVKYVFQEYFQRNPERYRHALQTGWRRTGIHF